MNSLRSTLSKITPHDYKYWKRWHSASGHPSLIFASIWERGSIMETHAHQNSQRVLMALYKTLWKCVAGKPCKLLHYNHSVLNTLDKKQLASLSSASMAPIFPGPCTWEHSYEVLTLYPLQRWFKTDSLKSRTCLCTAPCPNILANPRRNTSVTVVDPHLRPDLGF